MKLETLTIQRLPGIQEPIALTELGPDINVITGPNASGKSSLVRALRLLLAPERGDPPNVLLQATLTDDAHRWQVERFGRDTRWQRDGEPAEPPPLPDAEALAGYFLAVDELFELTHADQAFTRRLQRELAGGYDLSALRRNGGTLAIHPNRDRDAGNRLIQAEQHLREAEAGNRELLAQRGRLPELTAEIAHCGNALHRAHTYTAGLALVAARADTRQARLRLERFPESMPEGIDAREIAALEQGLREHQAAADQASRQADTAEQALRDTGLAEQRPGAAELADLRQQLTALGERASRRTQAEEQLTVARERARRAAEVVEASADTVPELDTRTLAELETRVQELATALAESREKRAVATAWAAPEGSDASAASASSRWPDVLAALAGLGGGLLLAFGSQQSPLWLTATGAVAVFGGLGWLAWRALWSGADAAGGGAREALHGERERLAQAAEERLEQARAELRRNAQAAGLAPEPDHLAQHFQIYLNRIAELDAAQRAVTEAEARLTHLAGEERDAAEAIRARLAAWDAAPDTATTDTLGRAIEALDERRQRAERLTQDIQRLREQQQQAATQHRETEQRLQDLYRRAGLEPGDRETLLARIEALPEWRAAREALREAEIRETTAQEQLPEDDPEVLARAAADDSAWLEEQRNHARADADRHEALIAEKTGIENAIRDAERDLRLEEARAARDQARETLRDRFEGRMVAEAGHFLLDDVERTHRQDHQPAAIRVADERLRQFTHNAFSLVVGEDGAPCARDSRSEGLRPLSALSVGTRMQLLIALRMAWVEQREHHHATLPLILDEALSTTDPERFDAVATALHAITRAQERQLVYLTAQPEDVERWQRATGTAPHVVSLPSVQGTAAPAEALTLPETAQLPEPDGHTPKSYGRALDVHALNPAGGVGAVPLFYLLTDDLPLLHRLMADFRLHTAGQAATFLDGNAGQRHLDQNTRQRLQTRLAAANAWIDAFHIGRGQTVDRPALEQSQMSNWKQLDALAERAMAVDGDPNAFLDSLRSDRIPGIGEGKIQQIADWLDSAGFLDPRPRLDATGRYHHVLSRLPDHPDAVAEARAVFDALERAAGIEESVDNVIAGW